jgi:restriction system protein
MRLMLEALADGAERDTVWLRNELADRFDVSTAERAELLPSGKRRLYDNRIAWAYVHLQHAGAIERVGRGVYASQIVDAPSSPTILTESTSRC